MNLRIGIWDMNYYESKRNFDTDCMKLSSFHKQSGDYVTLFEAETDLERPYDVIYIVRRNSDLPSPEPHYLHKRNVKLIGKGFRFFKTWTIPDYVLACRPDYLLYPQKLTRRDRAQMIQFCNHEGKWLELRQDDENSFKNKQVLVIDDCMWNSSLSTVNKCLDALKDMKNLSFLYEISLKTVMSNKTIREKFCNLNFCPDSNLKFINDWGHTYEDAQQICEFLMEIRRANPRTHIEAILFEPFLNGRHTCNADGIKDFQRCLDIVDLGKRNYIWFALAQPDRLQSSYAGLFEQLYKWTATRERWSISFIQFLTGKQRAKYCCSLETLFNNPQWWGDVVLGDFLITYKAHPEWLENYGYRTLGEKFDHSEEINWLNIDRSVI